MIYIYGSVRPSAAVEKMKKHTVMRLTKERHIIDAYVINRQKHVMIVGRMICMIRMR